MPRHDGVTQESPDENPSPEDDMVVVRRVLAAPPGDRVHRDFAETLNETGVGRLMSMAHGGHLFAALRELSIHLPQPPESWRQNYERLIHEAVYGETEAFIAGKIRKWDPKKGRSLANYYISGCLMRFASRYRIYYREEGGEGKERATADADLALLQEGSKWDIGSRPTSPESVAEDADLIRRLLSSETDPRNIEILFERAARDRTRKAVAEAYGISVEAVDARIRRMRKNRDEAQ